VCNYAYFLSLSKFGSGKRRPVPPRLRGGSASSVEKEPPPSSRGDSGGGGGGGGRREKREFRSLFVHVPPFDVIPEQEQLAFVARVMEEIRKQIVLDRESTKVTTTAAI